MEPLRFQATCFMAAGQDGSRACTLLLDRDSGVIAIEVAGQRLADWPYTQLKFDAAGDEEAYLLVTCPALPGSAVASLVVRDAECRENIAEFLAEPEREFVRHFGTRGRDQRRRKWRNLLIFTIVSVALLVGGYYGLIYGAAEFAARKMPVATEVKWGGLISQSFLADKRVVKSGPAVAAAKKIMARLTESLEQNPGYPFEIHVVDSPMVNALALPGGQVVVFTGLMEEAASADEVAGVLAHEIQHVMKRHVIKRIVSSLGWRAAAAILLGGSDLSSVAVGAGELLELSYGRDQELEADREGVRLMAQAGLPPEALASFFEKLRAKEAIRMPELISTHPGTDKRIAKLRELAGEAAPGVTRDLEIDWVEVRRSLPGSHAAAKP